MNAYDRCADAYARMIDEDTGKASSPYHGYVVPELLRFVGDPEGCDVLDAGCGEGHVSRELHRRGARIVGIDVSPRLVDYARERSAGMGIDYLVHDLSRALPPELEGRFDMAVSNLVVDDVPDYIGYVANLGWLTKPDGRMVLSKNNPYSAVIREKVERYFDSGPAAEYQGLSSRGVIAQYYHRTLEEHLTEFGKAGFCLTRLSDLRPTKELVGAGTEAESDLYQRFYHFPALMVLEFRKVG